MFQSEYEEAVVELKEKREGRIADKPRFLVIVVGLFIVSLSLITSGVACVEIAVHGNDVNWDGGHMLMMATYLDFIALPILLIVAGYGFKNEVYNISFFFLIYGMLNLVYAVACRMNELTNVSSAFICIVLGLFSLMPTLISIQKKSYLFAIGGIIMSLGLILGEMIHPGYMIWGVCGLVAGWIFAYVVIARVVYYEFGMIIPHF